jgi:DNA-binding MarR family transcriptional regulator
MKSELAKDNLYMRMVVNMLRIANNIDKKVSDVLRPFEITHVQFNVLRILELAHPKALSVGEIADGLFFPASDVTRLLDRLVKRGLVTRKICTVNRRKMDVAITQKGMEAIHHSLPKISNSLDGFYKNRLSLEERDAMLEMLAKLKD